MEVGEVPKGIRWSTEAEGPPKVRIGGVSGRGWGPKLGTWMPFMTWTRMTIHWIVSDCDLGEVSVYTPSKGCVGLRVTCCMDFMQVLEDKLRACVMDHKGRRAIALSGIRLQQQLPGEYTNGTIRGIVWEAM